MLNDSIKSLVLPVATVFYAALRYEGKNMYMINKTNTVTFNVLRSDDMMDQV